MHKNVWTQKCLKQKDASSINHSFLVYTPFSLWSFGVFFVFLSGWWWLTEKVIGQKSRGWQATHFFCGFCGCNRATLIVFMSFWSEKPRNCLCTYKKGFPGHLRATFFCSTRKHFFLDWLIAFSDWLVAFQIPVAFGRSISQITQKYF